MSGAEDLNQAVANTPKAAPSSPFAQPELPTAIVVGAASDVESAQAALAALVAAAVEAPALQRQGSIGETYFNNHEFVDDPPGVLY